MDRYRVFTKLRQVTDSFKTRTGTILEAHGSSMYTLYTGSNLFYYKKKMEKQIERLTAAG